MPTRTRNIAIASSIALLAVLCIFFLPRFRYVDEKPALELGGEYYSRLQRGEVDSAFNLYAVGFQRKAGAEWGKIINDLDAKNGNVTHFRPIASQIVPFHTPPDQILCVLVRYDVTRSTLTSEETLIACPHQPFAWAIAGHEIVSKRDGQRFSAGVSVQEKTIWKTK